MVMTRPITPSEGGIAKVFAMSRMNYFAVIVLKPLKNSENFFSLEVSEVTHKYKQYTSARTTQLLN